MNSFEDKSVNQIAKNIIKSFGDKECINKITVPINSKRKIQIRKIIKQLIKIPSVIILEQKKRETQDWSLVFVETTLIKKDILKKVDNDFNNEDDYKYIGFEIHLNLKEGQLDKTLFIRFSHHALIRIIERCDLEVLSNPIKVKSFLSSMIKTICLRCLSIYEEMHEEFENGNTQNYEIFKNRESYIVDNGLFMPIVMEIGKNRLGNPSFSFTIKTVMPDTYNGAKRTIEEKKLKETKENILDYTYLLSSLIANRY